MAAYTLYRWWIVLSCMVIIYNNEALACLEDEKNALLKLKDVINHQNGSIPHSWSDEKPDCCLWDWVTCDVSSKRIINLDLRPFKDWDPKYIDKWFLDSSLFQPFKELMNLTFRDSALLGLKGPLRLTKLQMLNLNGNGISHVPRLGELASLKFLDISANAITQGFEGICALTNLQELDLSKNNLEGAIPTCLSNLTSLRILKLSGNKLSGTIPSNVFSSLASLGGLEILDISDNSFSGKFPDWISKLPSLTFLAMSKNHFEGKLPASFCKLTKLIYIDLSWNNFSETLPPCINLRWLKFLHLQGNKFQGLLPTSLSMSSSMVTLDVRNNNFSGLIPAWISSLSDLIILLLKGNIFHGSIPVELCQLENLNILDLAANNLSGYIPTCLAHIPFGKNKLSESYKGIDLSLNNLTGPIPFDIGNWNMVHSLNLSYNHFSGSIPWTLSRLQTLESLDLSHNILSGEIPSQITELNFLSVFSVAYNNLSGPIPMTPHFTTFDASSYEGNPLLCGFPLDRSCNGPPPPPQHAKPST